MESTDDKFSYTLSKIYEQALKGCIEDQEYLENIFKEKWNSIRNRLEVKNNDWNTWWNDKVQRIEKRYQEF